MDSAELPFLENIYTDLKKGRHITNMDTDMHRSLSDHFDQYKGLFKALGYKLTRHRLDFFYLSAGPNSALIMQKFAAFYFIFLDHLADNFGTVSEALFNQRFPLPSLPHLKSERYKKIMSEVGVSVERDLENLVGRLQTAGFLHINNDKLITFDSPSHRFLDMCHDLVNPATSSDPIEDSDHD